MAKKSTQYLMASEVVKSVNISKAGANIALRQLVKSGFVTRSIKGRTHLYQADTRNCLIKQFKVLESVAGLYPLIEKIKNVSQQIILFGSAARGENLEDSDIDLFILTRAGDEIRAVIKKSDKSSKIKAVVKTPYSFAELERKDSVFYQEITRGVTIFEQ